MAKVTVTDNTAHYGGTLPVEFYKLSGGSYLYSLTPSETDPADDAEWHTITDTRFSLATTATRHIHFRLATDDENQVVLSKMPLNATQDTEDLS